MINFATLTEAEASAVDTIVERAINLLCNLGLREHADSFMVRMDLAAVHASNPLDLSALADADATNFSHDMLGILRHLDRETGELRDCFVPRFSLRASAGAATA